MITQPTERGARRRPQAGQRRQGLMRGGVSNIDQRRRQMQHTRDAGDAGSTRALLLFVTHTIDEADESHSQRQAVFHLRAQ